jgi:hypothetical protein
MFPKDAFSLVVARNSEYPEFVLEQRNPAFG